MTMLLLAGACFALVLLTALLCRWIDPKVTIDREGPS